MKKIDDLLRSIIYNLIRFSYKIKYDDTPESSGSVVFILIINVYVIAFGLLYDILTNSPQMTISIGVDVLIYIIIGIVYYLYFVRKVTLKIIMENTEYGKMKYKILTFCFAIGAFAMVTILILIGRSLN